MMQDSPKFYLFDLKNLDSPLLHRSLTTLRDYLERNQNGNFLLHLGYERPSIEAEYKNLGVSQKLLIHCSSTIVGALPSGFSFSKISTGKISTPQGVIDTYLCLEGFGYFINEESLIFQDQEDNTNQPLKQTIEVTCSTKDNDIYNLSIEALDLSVRSSNCLKASNIHTIGKLLTYSPTKLLKIPNFGKTSLNEITEKLSELSLVPGENSQKDWEPKKITEELFSEEIPSNTTLHDFDEIAKEALINQFASTLENITDSRNRRILELRSGFTQDHCFTLQETADEVGGITRERVRQVLNKEIKKIINRYGWDDLIEKKLSSLLEGRQNPLSIRLLEVEDPWFLNFDSKLHALDYIITEFTEKKFNVINISDINYISRATQNDIEHIRKFISENLNDDSFIATHAKTDVLEMIRSVLISRNCLELYELFEESTLQRLVFEDQSENSRILKVTQQKSNTVSKAILTTLTNADAPMHFSDIYKETRKACKKIKSERYVHSFLGNDENVLLFGRGVYGLKKHLKFDDINKEFIVKAAEEYIYEHDIQHQWHINTVLKAVQGYANCPSLLDTYQLNIILHESTRLNYLGRMIWARSDSGYSNSTQRIQIHEFYEKELEKAGTTLSTKQLQTRISKIRDIHIDFSQIQETEKMIKVAPSVWGLIDRDVIVTKLVKKGLDRLQIHLIKNKLINIDELDNLSWITSLDVEGITPYIFSQLAKRDQRFLLNKNGDLLLSGH